MGEDQKRTFLAIGLSALILFGWNYFFPNQKTSTPTAIESMQGKPIKAENKIDPSVLENINKNVELANQSKVYTFSATGSSITLDSYLNVTDFQSASSVFDYKEVVGEKGLIGLEMEVSGNTFLKLPFSFTSATESSFEAINEQNKIKVYGKFDELGKFLISVQSPSAIRYRFVVKSTEEKKDNGMIRNFSLLADGLETFEVGDTDNSEGKIKWLGVDFNYHLFAAAFPEKYASFYTASPDGVLYATLTAPLQNLNYSVIYTKKEYDKLISYGDNLKLSVDFGIWSLIAVPMLRILQFFNDYVSNYGLAIIFLTLVMRTLMLPLQYKSFKGMKKMQEIQPELTKIKERFKDDPARLQQESMNLFKKAGANPLGGCLPLIMQMPFFFAFYKVLFNSVELVGAPFIFWINDLSVKDPYFVLPVLMGIAMFLQQRLTPSPSTDETQKKVLMFMPVIFTFMMSSLPAGLTLYIFISTIFGVVTQALIFKKPSENKPIVV